MNEAAALRLVVSLLFIIVLILAAAWVTRRAGWLKTGGSDNIKVLGSRSLGARTCITVVQVDGARLVLGVTSSQISVLHTLPPATETPQEGQAPAGGAANFSASLRRALIRRR
jgi:flagellar protein FliO/FliZ